MAKKIYTGLEAERRAAKGYEGNARTTRGSGCGNDPADIVLDDYLIEHKATEKRSMSIKYDWLSKITRQASARGRSAALQISFVSGDGRPISGDASWVMVPAEKFKELIGDGDD